MAVRPAMLVGTVGMRMIPRPRFFGGPVAMSIVIVVVIVCVCHLQFPHPRWLERVSNRVRFPASSMAIIIRGYGI